jgi:D-alanine-D-alanine ligase
MKRLRVLVLLHEDLVPPDDPGDVAVETAAWKTEYDVVTTLRDLGHDVRPLGVRSDLGVIRKAVEEWRPHIAFNLLEEFDGVALYDQNVVAYLELLRVPYTGCNPRGLILSRDKALTKKILVYHRIPCPEFVVFPRGRMITRPARLGFPLIVKSLWEDASLGIAQASVVEDDDRLRERVTFVHQHLGTDAIAERYVHGRELYVGVLGNHRLRVLPVWELMMDRLPDDARPIATRRLKWSRSYQRKHGIRWGPAKVLPSEAEGRVQRLAKRTYRVLGLSGYARMDFRLSEDGRAYLLEGNPNPDIGYGEELAESAEKAGLSYEALLRRILNLGLRWRPPGVPPARAPTEGTHT